MSTTHGAVKTRCHEDTTGDVYLVGAGCVVCAQVRMGLGSGSKVWNPGTWIRCVLHTTTTSTAKVLCSGYGRDNHLVATCRFKSTEFFNSYPYAYKGSKAHKLLLAKYPDATAIPFTELSKDNPRSSASGSSSTKYGPKPTGESQTISDILSTMYSDTSDNNYIDVSVSATLQASIRTRNNVKLWLMRYSSLLYNHQVLP
jgi:hypothetical protein